MCSASKAQHGLAESLVMPVRGVSAIFMAVVVLFVAIWAKNLQIVIRVVPCVPVFMVDLQDTRDLVKPTSTAAILKTFEGGLSLLFRQPDTALPMSCSGSRSHSALKKSLFFKPAANSHWADIQSICDGVSTTPVCPQAPDQDFIKFWWSAMEAFSRAVLPTALVQHSHLNPEWSLAGLTDALRSMQLCPKLTSACPRARWLINVVALKGFVTDTAMMAV
jgi:hypothetical protein